jgi:hypothetical protein
VGRPEISSDRENMDTGLVVVDRQISVILKWIDFCQPAAVPASYRHTYSPGQMTLVHRQLNDQRHCCDVVARLSKPARAGPLTPAVRHVVHPVVTHRGVDTTSTHLHDGDLSP